MSPSMSPITPKTGTALTLLRDTAGLVVLVTLIAAVNMWSGLLAGTA